MQVVILVGIMLFCGFFAVSQPKYDQEFSPKRKKFNLACAGVLALALVVSLGSVVWNSFVGDRPEDFEIDTDIYCMVLKTDGHRLFSFLNEDYKLKPITLYGEDARKVMESAFGDMTDGTMVSWNETGSWQGKYNARVYYTQEEWERHEAGLAPLTVARNNTEKGVMYYFTIVENGKVYCNIGGTKPYYSIKLDREAKDLLF